MTILKTMYGLGVFPGTVQGEVQIIRSQRELNRKINGIVVAERITIDWLPFLKNSKAIVSEIGGVTCHAAVIAREFRIPCVVGVRGITKRVRNGLMISVDGKTGEITEL